MRIQVLGPVRGWRGGAEVDLGGTGQRAVLAVLALAGGQPVPVPELVDVLWPDRPPSAPANVVQTYVKHLRRLLEPDRRRYAASSVLPTAANGYALRLPTDALDLARFRSLVGAAGKARAEGEPRAAASLLADALRLWQGTPFAGIPVLAGHPKAVALFGERQAALAQYAEVTIAAGIAADAVPILTEVAAAEPLDEAAQAQLIRAYHAAGQRALAFEVFHTARRRLSDELGIGPGPELAAAHAALLGHDPPRTRPAAPAAGPGAPPVPAQLPADVPAFAGRGAELAALTEALVARGRAAAPVLALSGTAGVGKTALAVHWAHRTVDQFPDGQLYVNLRGFDPAGRVLSASDALRGFLESLGVPPEHIPSTPDTQAALYRSLLSGRRVLVVLDNARDAEQVRPLLPGAPTAVALVTSRDKLTSLVAAAGARPLVLDVLSPDDAWDLLARRLGADRLQAEPQAGQEIIDHCVRLPLALTIAAARAAVRPTFPLATVAAELAEVHGRLDALTAGAAISEVRAVFSWSYAALSAAAARLFRLLGLHPGPDVSVAAAASLTGVPPAEVRPQLAELDRANLIVEHAPGRYACHDLLRAYAADLGSRGEPADARSAATGRMLDHYVHTAHAAARLFYPSREPITLALSGPAPGVTPERLCGFEAATAWLTAEYPVLLGVLRLAGDAGFDTVGWQLAWALTTFQDRRGRWSDLAGGWQVAVAAADRLGHPAAQAEARRRLGVAETMLGRHADGEARLRAALDLFTAAGDRVGSANTHHDLAVLGWRRRRPDPGLDHARHALALFRAAGNVRGQAHSLNGIGWLQAQLGNYGEARGACTQALTLFEQVGDRDGQAAALDSIGFAHHHSGNHQEAVENYRQAIALFHDLGDRYEKASTLVRLGDTYAAAGRPAASHSVWRAALADLTELNHPDAEDVRSRLG